jgi:hypothetical protein
VPVVVVVVVVVGAVAIAVAYVVVVVAIAVAVTIPSPLPCLFDCRVSAAAAVVVVVVVISLPPPPLCADTIYSSRHDTDTAYEPTRRNVADMVYVVSATLRRHVGMSVVLGGKNPRHDADISSQVARERKFKSRIRRARTSSNSALNRAFCGGLVAK